MSTRGALGFKLDGKYYVTYNHMDSYPKELGAEVVRFCDSVNGADGWESLKKNVRKVKLVDNETSKPTCINILKYCKYQNLTVNRRTIHEWYCLLRNLQNGEILWGIRDGKIRHMINSFEFLGDSCSCEYAYIINLDDMTLCFYRGGQTEPSVNHLPISMIADEYGFYPVKLRVIFQLGKLPHNWLNSAERKQLALDRIA